VVIDQIMPTLKDTEFRLLLVVLRQTWGWRGADGAPKAADWLTHGQLRQRTGKASEAVSGAVDALVRRRLLCVFDAAGRRLDTAAERRRARGKLFFAPSPALAALGQNLGKCEGRREIDQPKTTKDGDISISCGFRKPGPLDGTPGEPPGISAGDTPRREHIKAAIRTQLAALSATRGHQDKGSRSS
jgi:hypothetical protein